MRSPSVILPILLTSLACGGDIAPGLESPEELWWEEDASEVDPVPTSESDTNLLYSRAWFALLALPDNIPAGGSQSFVWVDNGAIQCEVIYSLGAAVSLSDCAACSMAWEFSRSAPSIIKDKEDACVSWGVTSLENTGFVIGIDDKSFYYQENDTWKEGGLFEKESDTIQFSLEEN